MKSYFIENTNTKQQAWSDANSFPEACDNLGWLRMDCLCLSTTVDKNVDKLDNDVREVLVKGTHRERVAMRRVKRTNGEQVITDQHHYPKTIRFPWTKNNRLAGGHSIKAIYFGKHGITIETESAYDQLAKQDRVREQAKDMPRDHRGRFTDGFHKIKLPNDWGKVRLDKNGEKLIF